MTSMSMRQMLEAGVHFGHQTRFWNPKMAPFIFGERNRIHIINLEKTLPLYNEAAALHPPGRRRRRPRAVRRHQALGARSRSRQEAIRCGMPYVSHRWLGGMLTNFKTVRQSIKRLTTLDEMAANGTLEQHSKREAQGLRREREKLERSLGGIKEMESLPDVLFVIDVGHEKIAIHEAKKLGIPVVAIVDTNCAPEDVDYVDSGQRRRHARHPAVRRGHRRRGARRPVGAAGSAGRRRRVRRARRRRQAEAEERRARAAPRPCRPPCQEDSRRAVARRRRCRRPSRSRKSSPPKSTTSRRRVARRVHGAPQGRARQAQAEAMACTLRQPPLPAAAVAAPGAPTARQRRSNPWLLQLKQ